MEYNRDAILKFLSSTPKGLYDSDKRYAYETIDRYLREHPDDTEVRDLLLKHALETPLTAGGGKAMLSAALAHHPNPDARDRLLERALKSEYRDILEWGVKELHALPPHERNPDLVRLLAHRAEAASYPAVDAFMRDTLAPDDYNAFRSVVNSIASSHLPRSRDETEQLWRALLRLEQLWGSSVLLPYIGRVMGHASLATGSTILHNSVLVRRVAERHWNASGRDLLRAIVDTEPSEWKHWGFRHYERVEFWRHAVVGVALDDVDAAFDHLLHDVLGDQKRFEELFDPGDWATNTLLFTQLLCVPLGWASPAQLERMRAEVHAFAARLPEWIANDETLMRRFIRPRTLTPWVGESTALVGNIQYALRPLVRAAYHALAEKGWEDRNTLAYTALGLLPTLLVDRAEDIPPKQEMLRVMDKKDNIQQGNYVNVVETAQPLLKTAFAWDDSNAAEWNKRVRASDELQAFLASTAPLTHALWEIAMAGMPGAPSRESVYESVLNRLSTPNTSLEDVDKNLREILNVLKSLPRDRMNPEWEVMRFTRLVRERFGSAVYEEFVRGLHGDSWDDRLDFLSRLIGVLHGETDEDRFLPHLIMPSELLTANPHVVNEKLRSLHEERLWELESALEQKFCS
jgi:hypothetical protein